MASHSHVRGNPTTYDHEASLWRYDEDGTPVPDDPRLEKPCVRCGRMPLPTGEDACLGHIPGLSSACCGHGVQPSSRFDAGGREVTP